MKALLVLDLILCLLWFSMMVAAFKAHREDKALLAEVGALLAQAEALHAETIKAARMKGEQQ